MARLTVRQNIPEDQQGEVGELDEEEGIGGCRGGREVGEFVKCVG